MNIKRVSAIVLSLLTVFFLFCSCASKGVTTADEAKTTAPAAAATDSSKENEEEATTSADKKNGSTDANHPQVKVKMENGGEFTIELYPEYAPKTVENFLKLVNDGFYNGLTFHRVVAGFMAQGGDPDGNGTGGSKDTVFGEFASNGFEQNTLSHTRGVISMARSAENNSASSQFFICYADVSAALDGDYAAFGKVISGMETVDDFCNVPMTYNTMGEKASPTEPIYIKSITEIK